MLRCQRIIKQCLAHTAARPLVSSIGISRSFVRNSNLPLPIQSIPPAAKRIRCQDQTTRCFSARTSSNSTYARSSPSSSSPPPPPRSPSKFEIELSALVRRSIQLLRQGTGAAYAYASSHPQYILLLLAACFAGFLYGRSRGSAVIPSRVIRTTAPLPSFKLPSWTDTKEKKEMACAIHVLPLAVSLMHEGKEDQPIGAKRLSSIPTGILAPNITPAQLMERLRVLFNDPALLDLLASQVDASLFISPLVDLACSPSVPPAMSKYAAACLDRLCCQKDGRLCKMVAQHSTHDLLVALSPYTDFLAWNYLYLLQQNPELVEYAEQQAAEARREGVAQAPSLDEPAYLRAFHNHSSSDSSTLDSGSSEEQLTFNRDPSPVSVFLSKHLPGSPSATAIPHPPSQISSDVQDLIDLLLSLPAVHYSSQDSAVGIFQHALSTGAAQRERGSGFVTVAREMGKDVVQHGAALAAAFRSSLAEDDLAVIRRYGSPHMLSKYLKSEEQTTAEKVKEAAREMKRQAAFVLHSILSRRPGYKIGHAAAMDRKAARKQEISYHAFRAFATLSQDPSTAGMIVDAGGIDLLYRVYQQYPHELRVQIQVARALANLLEHAHANTRQELTTGMQEQDVRYATYHAVAKSGFLPMLVHWTQHALNYTDAAPTTTKTKSKSRRHREKKPPILRPEQPLPPVNPDIALVGGVAISTQPSNPLMRDRQLAHLERLEKNLHANDERPSLPIPPPVVQAPQDIASAPAVSSLSLPSDDDDGVMHADSDPHPLRQPHHPESAASLRNKLQLQAARALVNMRSVLAYKYLTDHEEDRELWIEKHGAVSFPLLSDEVYQFYPIVDTLQPLQDTIRQSSAQKNSKSGKKNGAAKVTELHPVSVPPSPLPPPKIEYDIVFLHGLMGNPLRTWRLHSMHDRTIGWIPSTPEEKRRAGMLPNGMKGRTLIVEPAEENSTKLTPLERHLSNIVSSGPLPVEPTIVSVEPTSDVNSDPAVMADRTSIWGDLSFPFTPREKEDPTVVEFDPSPAAGPNAPIEQPTPANLALQPPHAPIYSSQHSLDFETLWPRDWLPSAFPQARILSLGYYTGLSMKTTGEMHSKSLDDRAQEMVQKMDLAGIGKDGRKVIWVTHSMGGLVVKKVLLQIAQAQRAAAFRGMDPSSASYSQLLDNTIATVFYSTPHNGTWLPVLSQEGLFSYVMVPSHELIDLQNQSKLRAMNDEFKREVIDRRGVQSLAFGEGIGTPLVHINRTAQKMVTWKFVPVDSSQPGFGRYLYFPTQNHLTICKPKTELDENYSALTAFLREAMEAHHQ